MIDFPNIPMPQPLNMSLAAPQKPQPNAMSAMGTKLLQAALDQNKKNPAVPQPAVGAQMPGGAMNITPAAPQVGILQRLLGNFAGGGGGAPPMMDSTNALY